MEPKTLPLQNHTATLYADGMLNVVSNHGVASILLSSQDTYALLTWLSSMNQTLMFEGPEPHAMTCFRVLASSYTRIEGYEGWTWKEYQTGRRYREITLFYHGEPVVFLKGWREHFTDEQNAQVRYDTLTAAIEAYKDSACVQRIDRMRHRP